MNKKTKIDFEDFVKPSECIMPDTIERSIRENIVSKMCPTTISVLGRILIIYAVAGLISVYLCPQLGIGFHTSTTIVDFFMKYGHDVCTLMCGAFYLSLGTVFSLVLLPKDFRRVFMSNVFVLVPVIAIISLTVFLLLGANEKVLHYVYWIIGGIISSYMITKSTELALRPSGLTL